MRAARSTGISLYRIETVGAFRVFAGRFVVAVSSLWYLRRALMNVYLL